MCLAESASIDSLFLSLVEDERRPGDRGRAEGGEREGVRRGCLDVFPLVRLQTKGNVVPTGECSVCLTSRAVSVGGRCEHRTSVEKENLAAQHTHTYLRVATRTLTQTTHCSHAGLALRKPRPSAARLRGNSYLQAERVGIVPVAEVAREVAHLHLLGFGARTKRGLWERGIRMILVFTDRDAMHAERWDPEPCYSIAGAPLHSRSSKCRPLYVFFFSPGVDHAHTTLLRVLHTMPPL